MSNLYDRIRAMIPTGTAIDSVTATHVTADLVELVGQVIDENRIAWEAGASGRVRTELRDQREQIACAIESWGMTSADWRAAADIARQYRTESEAAR